MNRLTILSTLAFAATFSTTYAQDLSKKISFYAPCAPASKVLADLSKELGLELHASQATANEGLVIKVREVSIAELMDRIAKSVDAEWQKDGEAYKLVRSSAIEQRERQAETTARALQIKAALAKATPIDKGSPDEKTLRKYIDGVVAKTAKAFRDSQQKAQPTEVYGDTSLNNPAGRAIWGMISLIGPERLASIRLGERVVFSTAPTRVQSPFPGDTAQVLGRFLNEQRLFAKVLKEAEEESGVEDKEVLFHMDSLANGVSGPGNPNLGIGRALLVVNKIIGDSLQFRLMVTDPKGQQIGGGACTITPDKPKPVQTLADPTSITFSPETLELAKFITGSRNSTIISSLLMSKNDAGEPVNVRIGGVPDGAGMHRASAEVRELILNPDKLDPMSFGPTDGFVSIADAHHENLVARLPDSAFTPIMTAVSKKATIGTFLGLCANQWGIEVHEGDGWLMANPKEPIAADQSCFDRSALAALMKRVDALGYIGLDDLSAYAVAQGEHGLSEGCALQYLAILNPAASYQIYGIGEWSIVRFFGTLNDSQRQTLVNGGDIALQNLSEEQSSILADITYNSYDGPVVGAPDDPKIHDRFSFVGRASSPERTDALPNGVITNGVLHIGHRISPAAYEENSISGAGRFLTVDDAADGQLIAETDDPFVARLVPRKPVFDRYREATTSDYSFTFIFAKDLSIQRSLHDASFGTGSQSGPYGSLSAGFRQSVENRMVNLRQALKNYTSQMRQNKVPPPMWTLASKRRK